MKLFQVILTLLAERHHEYARSQAPAWERTVLEAPPPVLFFSTTSRQAEPAIHWVPRQSLGTSWWRSWWRSWWSSPRSVVFFHSFLPAENLQSRQITWIFFALIVLGMLSLPNATVGETPQNKPNIIFILADDLGYGELGCYGQQKIRTPHLDQLAKEGMRFTQHYTGAPVCAPARCVLLTGQALHRAQIRGNRDSGNGRPFPGQWPITDEAVTLAEVLKKAGYATGGFGKWGLGPTDSTGSPIRQGFDRFFGYNCQRNAHSFYPHFLDSDDHQIEINKNPIPGHKKQAEGDVLAETYRAENYAPDLILAESLKFLDANAKKPFFLYLPFVEPHVSMHPHQASIDKYPVEWDQEHGPYRGQNGYLPHPRPRAAYASMISDLDNHVGTILKKLEELGVAENTLIVFTSDNGPTHGGGDKRWHVGGAGVDFFESNGGLKGFKGSCDEGGIRVPCIVRWTGKVKPNSVSELPSYFPDWFPTLAKIGEADLPEQQVLDGIDISGELTGETHPDRKAPLVWEFPEYGGFVALRQGDWKAIRRKLNTDKPGKWELYDLKADREESNNLADKQPEIVQRLERHYLDTRVPNPLFPIKAYDRDSAAK